MRGGPSRRSRRNPTTAPLVIGSSPSRAGPRSAGAMGRHGDPLGAVAGQPLVGRCAADRQFDSPARLGGQLGVVTRQVVHAASRLSGG
jgi:hypothetical protein